MSTKNENINEEVKNAEETAEDIKDTETKEEASKEKRQRKQPLMTRLQNQKRPQLTGKTNIRD